MLLRKKQNTQIHGRNGTQTNAFETKKLYFAEQAPIRIEIKILS